VRGGRNKLRLPKVTGHEEEPSRERHCCRRVGRQQIVNGGELEERQVCGCLKVGYGQKKKNLGLKGRGNPMEVKKNCGLKCPRSGGACRRRGETAGTVRMNGDEGKIKLVVTNTRMYIVGFVFGRKRFGEKKKNRGETCGLEDQGAEVAHGRTQCKSQTAPQRGKKKKKCTREG